MRLEEKGGGRILERKKEENVEMRKLEWNIEEFGEKKWRCKGKGEKVSGEIVDIGKERGKILRIGMKERNKK